MPRSERRARNEIIERERERESFGNSGAGRKIGKRGNAKAREKEDGRGTGEQGKRGRKKDGEARLSLSERRKERDARCVDEKKINPL